MLQAQFSTYDVIQKAAEGRPTSLVWPDEGHFTAANTFQFNEEHAGFEPLLIDKTSATMICTLHDALNDANKAKLKEFVARDRGHFGLIWQLTEERVRFTGFRAPGAD